MKRFGGNFGRVSKTKLSGLFEIAHWRLVRGDEANQRSLSVGTYLQNRMQTDLVDSSHILHTINY